MSKPILALLLCVLASPLLAQAPGASAAPAGPPAPATNFVAPQPAPENEQMRKWEGSWKTVATFSRGGMMPEGGEARGSYTSVRGLNGHAFIGDYKASGTGGDLAGHGVRMFDPVSRTWKTWWYDSWVPGHVDLSIGEVGADGAFVTESDSEYQGNKFRVRITERWTDDNSVEQAYESDLGAGWVPVMSITYTRKGKWKEKPSPREKKAKRTRDEDDKPKDADQDERPRKKADKSGKKDEKQGDKKPENKDEKRSSDAR